MEPFNSLPMQTQWSEYHSNVNDSLQDDMHNYSRNDQNDVSMEYPNLLMVSRDVMWSSASTNIIQCSNHHNSVSSGDVIENGINLSDDHINNYSDTASSLTTTISTLTRVLRDGELEQEEDLWSTLPPISLQEATQPLAEMISLPEPEVKANAGNINERVKPQRSRKGLPEHIQILQDNPKLFLCTACTRKFKTRRNVYYHSYCKNGQDKAKPFKCSQCPKEFIMKSHFDFHIQKHSNERPFNCPKCPKKYKTAFDLKRHINKFHEKMENKKRYHCTQCDHSFVTLQVLKEHLKIHSGDKPFVCQYCNECFTRAYTRDKHELIHTGQKPWKCDQCEKKFAQKYCLDLHKKTHSNERPFLCGWEGCQKRFVAERILQRHLIIHKNERQFKCNISGCEEAFNRQDYLKRHMLFTHSRGN